MRNKKSACAISSYGSFITETIFAKYIYRVCDIYNFIYRNCDINVCIAGTLIMLPSLRDLDLSEITYLINFCILGKTANRD